MKKLVYNVALALCAMVTINSCSLDEYNPMEVTGEETLATFDGWYGMQTLTGVCSLQASSCIPFWKGIVSCIL